MRGRMLGHGARQQGLAGAGRADHQHVVPPGRGHLQGALDVLLPFDLGEIGLHIDRQVLEAGREAAAVMQRSPVRWASSAVSVGTGMTSRSGIRAASAAST